MEIVNILLNNGANINSAGMNGSPPLYNAIGPKSSTEIVNILLNRGADINAVNNKGRPRVTR